MSRVRRTTDRQAATRAHARMAAAEALGTSEVDGPPVVISVLVWDDGRPPRYPAVGLHPGAIDGTTPHRCRLVTRG